MTHQACILQVVNQPARSGHQHITPPILQPLELTAAIQGHQLGASTHMLARKLVPRNVQGCAK